MTASAPSDNLRGWCSYCDIIVRNSEMQGVTHNNCGHPVRCWPVSREDQGEKVVVDTLSLILGSDPNQPIDKIELSHSDWCRARDFVVGRAEEGVVLCGDFRIYGPNFLLGSVPCCIGEGATDGYPNIFLKGL